MADNLSQLLATPLQPLREQWYSAAQAELLGVARARHDESPDAYWTGVAEQQRWTQPRDTVRTGELGDFTYFGGVRMNIADNCVDRWAEDPVTASRTAVIWEGEPGDVRTVTYAELAGEVSRLAGALASLGLAKGDVVAIYMPNAKEVSAQVASRLGGYARVGAVYLTPALPKTRTGKIMRRLLRDVVEHGAPEEDTSAMGDLAGLQAVQQAVAAEAAPSV
jgi:acetyl-CoA synthetase